MLDDPSHGCAPGHANRSHLHLCRLSHPEPRHDHSEFDAQRPSPEASANPALASVVSLHPALSKRCRSTHIVVYKRDFGPLVLSELCG
jgi:hypothetical protein